MSYLLDKLSVMVLASPGSWFKTVLPFNRLKLIGTGLLEGNTKCRILRMEAWNSMQLTSVASSVFIETRIFSAPDMPSTIFLWTDLTAFVEFKVENGDGFSPSLLAWLSLLVKGFLSCCSLPLST
uniref:Mediator of RNA polymerase II transcription subunit 13 n=1 Tax=Rhizophora mucronata TaxID=61149 RepID=A0A2P2MM29_RHIMU